MYVCGSFNRCQRTCIMITELKVTRREVYGCPTIYPACEQSKRFAAILGTKTIPMIKASDIKAMGFTFVIVNEGGL